MILTRLHKYFLITAICLISSHFAFSQGERKFITFSGYVVDGKSQESLPGATVMIPRAGKGTITNSQGFFTINAFPGDSIVFSFLGFKKQFHIIPKTVDLSYSAVIGLRLDSKMLREVKVYPYRTEEEFKEALIEMKIPDEREREILAQTFNPYSLRVLSAIHGMNSEANFRYAMNLQNNAYANVGQTTMNPLFNPFAWASFISGIKKGSFKDKSWKAAADQAPHDNITRDEFFRNGGSPTLSVGKN